MGHTVHISGFSISIHMPDKEYRKYDSLKAHDFNFGSA